MFNLNNLIKNLIYILGFSATLTSFYLTIYNPIADASAGTKFLLLLVFMLVNLGIAIAISWPRSKIRIRITDTINLNIYYDDLFQQNGIIIIPVNEYFDTIVDGQIISSSTVHGQFIKRIFGGNTGELQSLIKKELEKYEMKEIVYRNGSNCGKYPLGTTISVSKDGKDYFLVALTRFDNFNKAESFNNDYQVSLKSLLDYIHNNSQGKNINIPLIGAGQSGVKLTKQKLLEYLLFSLKLHDNLTISGEVNIVLKKELKKDIDLNKVKKLFST